MNFDVSTQIARYQPIPGNSAITNLPKNIAHIPVRLLLGQPCPRFLRTDISVLHHNLLKYLIHTLRKLARTPTKENLRPTPKQRHNLFLVRLQPLAHVLETSTHLGMMREAWPYRH